MEQNEANLYNPLFKSHILNDEGIVKAKKQGLLFHDFFNELHSLTFGGMGADTPNWEGREWSIVKTKLEEAAFYAKKAMAIRPEHQK